MKPVIVTTSWDDGHVLDLTLADLLRAHGIAGTFYISPADREVAHSKRLTAAQVAELGRDFEIGAHTLSHPRLSAIGDDEARAEIAGSKKVLERTLGKPVTSFCYPGGDFQEKHTAMVRDAGFSLARTTERFRTDAGADPFTLPTTAHAYRHWSDAGPIWRTNGTVVGFIRNYLRWDDLAIALFDRVIAEGGIFHLWGHSWEIDARGDWNRLTRVLAHIAKRPGVKYAANAELLSK